MPSEFSKGVLPTFVAEEREQVADLTADLVAIHVYRELQIKNDLARVAGCNIIGNCSNGSCDIIGNCSSSSKAALLRERR
jgi:hypothetical protein